METVKSENFKEAIVSTKVLDDGSLVVVDSKTTIRFLKKDTLELANGFRANIKHDRYKAQVVAFSNDGSVFAAVSADCKEFRLYNANTKKLIVKINRHPGEVACVGIDNANKFAFSCGDDGRTIAIDIARRKLAFSLPVHADTVNDIAFSADGHWVATASYDKRIVLFNLSMMAPKKHTLNAHGAPIMKTTFIGDKKLASVDKDNVAIIWDIYTEKVLSRLKGIHDDVTQITTAENDTLLFMGTALGYIFVYDLKTYEQLSSKYIKVNSAITNLYFDEKDKHLVLSCRNGDVLFYNIYEGEEHIKKLVKEKKYAGIHKYIEENPVLQYTKVYALVSNLWEKTLLKAKQCLEKGDQKTADTLFSHFIKDPIKNKIIQKTIKDYSEFSKFTASAKGGKLVLAYSIAQSHPPYRQSALYKALETRWKKEFLIAEKYAMDKKATDRARETLALYRGVNNKSQLMQELFTQSEIYKGFRAAITKKDYVDIFKRVKLHPFLREYPGYGTVMDYAENLYAKTQDLISSGQSHLAVKILRALTQFPHYLTEVKELLVSIESKQKFLAAIKDEEMTIAYEMLDSSAELLKTEDGKRLHEQWTKDMDIAKSFSIKGDIFGVKNSLQDYMLMSSKYMAIGTVCGWCYIMQLEQAVKDESEQKIIERGISNYIFHFGLQEQILFFHKIFKIRYPETKLDLEELTSGSLHVWQPPMIVNSILETMS